MRTLPLFLAFAAVLPAQSLGDPLTFIRVVRRHVSPRDPIAVYRVAKPPVDVIGMRSVTGSSQVWLIEAHGSWTSLEQLDQALSKTWTTGDAEDELIAPALSMIALYRYGLSYRPDEAVKLMPGARYLQVSIYRSRPGFDVDFQELIRMRRAVLDSVNSDRPELGYQVISGATTGTYLFLSPLVSLRTLDESMGRWPGFREGILVGVPKGGGRQIAAEGDITREHLLFKVEPAWRWLPRSDQ